MCDYLIIKSKIRPYLKYYLLTHKEIPKHIVNIIDQTPPITLENSLALPLENFKIYGRTTQKQLSGKNLLRSYAEAGTIKDVAISINDDGTIIANGLNDGTGNSQFFIDKYADGYTLPAGSYIINGCPSGGGINSYRIGIQNIVDGSYNTLAVDTGSGASFTLTETTTLIVFIIVQKNYNANNLLFKPMIRLASVTDDNYEQFCGGQPSPNPDFPQPIQNVSGDITISVSDENNTNSQEVVFPLAENQKLMEGDYIDEDGIHHVRTKTTLNGTERWDKDINRDIDVDYFYLRGIPINTSNINSVKCTHFLQGTLDIQGFWATRFFGITIDKTFTGIVAEDSKEERINKFKNWLSNHNTILEYELAEETLETFTEAQATKFEEIKALTGYNNITIVDVTSSDLTPNLSFDYYAKGR